MKIVVLGALGFVGSRLSAALKQTNQVIGLTRHHIDLLSGSAVCDFLKRENVDVIINAAATMTDNTLLYDTRNNLGIFVNFYNQRHLFKKFINLTSGAELDRSRNIDNCLEQDLINVLPEDSYGFGQNIKTRICLETENFYSIRIFNCFGFGEIPTRIFPRLIRQDEVIIDNDRYFDYFAIQDLTKLVDYMINNDSVYKDINAVYVNKTLISHTARLFCHIHNLDRKIVVGSTSLNNYTGNGDRLSSLGLDLIGLEQGLIKYFQIDY